jgi:hypothetical protein
MICMDVALDYRTSDNTSMGHPRNSPRLRVSELLDQGIPRQEECHDLDLLEWLAKRGVREPDWSLDPCIFDQGDRQSTGEENPIKLPNQPIVSGVYLFYSRTREGIIALYVGKAANLWNRMQTHWCRPEERGWINRYLEEIEKGSLDDVVMACAWCEEERAGMEARLIRSLRPRYCRRQE